MTTLKSMIVQKAFRRDAGSSGLEYAALIGVTATLVAVLMAGLPGILTEHVGIALCKVFQQDPCPYAPPKERKEAVQCTSNQVTSVKTKGFDVLFYKNKDSDTTIVTERSDGEIWETDTSGESNGFNAEFGFGLEVRGKGAGVSLAIGEDWGSNKSIMWKFDSWRQRDEFHRRVTAEVRRGFKSDGFAVLNKQDEISFDIALKMGVEFSTSYGSENTNHRGAGASYGIGEINYSEKTVRTVGTTRNSDGTIIRTYQSDNTYGVSADAGIFLAKAGSQLDWADGSLISVYYDKHGKPEKAIITSSTGRVGDVGASVFHWNHRRKDGVDEKGGRFDTGGPQPDQGGKFGGQWRPWSVGDQSTTEIHVPLKDDPHAQELVAGLISPFNSTRSYPGGYLGLTQDFGDLVADKGAIYNMQYEKDRSKSGINFGGSFGVNIGGYEDSTEETSLKITNASIVDPVTGERRPWKDCMG